MSFWLCVKYSRREGASQTFLKPRILVSSNYLSPKGFVPFFPAILFPRVESYACDAYRHICFGNSVQKKKILGYTVGEKFIETWQGEIYMKTKSMIQQRMK